MRKHPCSDIGPPLRKPALHEGLSPGRNPSQPRRRGLYRRHVHRLRQVREELSLRRDSDGVGETESLQAQPSPMAHDRLHVRAGPRAAIDDEGSGQGCREVRYVQGRFRRSGVRSSVPNGCGNPCESGEIPGLRRQLGDVPPSRVWHAALEADDAGGQLGPRRATVTTSAERSDLAVSRTHRCSRSRRAWISRI